MGPARDPRRHFRSALGHLRRWLRPPRRLRPTRAGWCFFALTFGVGFAALNTGNNLLYLVLALMLAFLVLSGVLSEAALRGIAVRRRLPRELFAGRPASVGLEIENDQRRAVAFAIVVEDRLLEPGGGERAAGRCFALRIGPGERALRSYRIEPERRGPLHFAGFQVFTRFPFGLFSKSLTLELPGEALVYPGVEPLRASHSWAGRSEPGDQRARPAGDGSGVSGLREHAPGDSLRRIHWRASLRHGELLVRRVEGDADAEVEVRLRTSGRSPGETFERAVRWAASEVVVHLGAGARVALRTDAEHLAAGSGTRQRAQLLGFLALVEPESRESAEAA